MQQQWGKPMRLILIRHGESQHGVRGMIAGMRGCTGLTEKGFRQAHELAGRLAATSGFNDCNRLLCSPVRRAQQTAEILLGGLPVDSMDEDIDLCEVHPGEADGLSWVDYRERYGEFDLIASPDRPFSPGGESWSQFLIRVRSTLDRLPVQHAGQTVVAVTHAGFIVASILVLFDIPRPGSGARLDPEYLSVTEWSVEAGRWKLVRFGGGILTP